MAQDNVEKSLADAEWHLYMAEKAGEEEAPNRIQVNYGVDVKDTYRAP